MRTVPSLNHLIAAEASGIVQSEVEIGIAWQGLPITLTVLTWFCSFGLPHILISSAFSYWEEIQTEDRIRFRKNYLRQMLQTKDEVPF